MSTPESKVIDKVAMEATLQETVDKKVKEEVSKVEMMMQNQAMRMRVPFGFNQYQNPDVKFGSNIPFSFLRRMAVAYPIARACINRRIRQITQLEWDITTVDQEKDENGYQAQIDVVLEFFKHPLGHKSRFRKMISAMIDDILTVDAVCFEYRRTRGGQLLNLLQVDPTTIVLRVDESGAVPEPPEIAYAQVIFGKKVAEFTTNEMLYDFMGSRSYSPYGLAPLESLILQTEAALRGTLYNLGYFRENNVPEGFITLPEEVADSQDKIKEWQNWFDSILAGDMRTIHRLKMLPGGAEYIPAKKPEDMSFEKFELWLMQQTCAVFDVPPQDIGLTYQVNKATGEIQKDLSRERGLLPLANYIKEILDEIIQTELGFTDLQFQWQNINPVDRKEEVEVAAKEIEMGAKSVDEYRVEQGWEPIGLGPYIKTGTGPMLVSDLLTAAEQGVSTVGAVNNKNQTDQQAQLDQQAQDNQANQQEDAQQKDIKRWKKVVYNDISQGKAIKANFVSEFIPKETHDMIAKGLQVVKTKAQAKILFDRFLDPDYEAANSLVKVAKQLRRIENAEFLAD